MPVFPTSTSHAWRFRIRRRPAAIAACTAFLLTAALTASAHAQIDVSEETGLDLDTGWTPVAKETPLWQQLGGAEFGSNRATKGSPTPAELDLFDVAFLDELNGIAGAPSARITATRSKAASASR